MPSLHFLYALAPSYKENQESVSARVWCVPGLGAGFEVALKPSKLQKEAEKPEPGSSRIAMR